MQYAHIKLSWYWNRNRIALAIEEPPTSLPKYTSTQKLLALFEHDLSQLERAKEVSAVGFEHTMNFLYLFGHILACFDQRVGVQNFMANVVIINFNLTINQPA